MGSHTGLGPNCILPHVLTDYPLGSDGLRGFKPVLAGLGIRHNGGRSLEPVMRLGLVEVDESRLAEVCRRHRVRELSVFGSAARGEMRPDSDVDLLVEFLPEAEPGLLDHAGLMLDLSELLGRRVDLVSKNGLKPLIRDSVIQDARCVYAA